jgi:hypothetical protein
LLSSAENERVNIRSKLSDQERTQGEAVWG